MKEQERIKITSNQINQNIQIQDIERNKHNKIAPNCFIFLY